eukprot:CAMPEP_0113917196 /NCGR_PEP_ID=MMETSP0780_2-20120614/32584_1 /TAXON_ID=652834 /ORGANISM="Palpitomonas bilix" /LENGTH=472 /DNA_ID=CAMNT_0000916711 /DNA_START=815 /DNA_END=2233 /DNA_ORIENTATION=- /assembly_acc=CAM_ASM_000599
MSTSNSARHSFPQASGNESQDDFDEAHLRKKTALFTPQRVLQLMELRLDRGVNSKNETPQIVHFCLCCVIICIETQLKQAGKIRPIDSGELVDAVRTVLSEATDCPKTLAVLNKKEEYQWKRLLRAAVKRYAEHFRVRDYKSDNARHFKVSVITKGNREKVGPYDDRVSVEIRQRLFDALKPASAAKKGVKGANPAISAAPQQPMKNGKPKKNEKKQSAVALDSLPPALPTQPPLQPPLQPVPALPLRSTSLPTPTVASGNAPFAFNPLLFNPATSLMMPNVVPNSSPMFGFAAATRATSVNFPPSAQRLPDVRAVLASATAAVAASARAAAASASTPAQAQIQAPAPVVASPSTPVCDAAAVKVEKVKEKPLPRKPRLAIVPLTKMQLKFKFSRARVQRKKLIREKAQMLQEVSARLRASSRRLAQVSSSLMKALKGGTLTKKRVSKKTTLADKWMAKRAAKELGRALSKK